MRNFSPSPIEMLHSLWRNRGLISSLIKREVVGRYRGSFMGILWSFFNPVFMLAVYTFVFSVVFEARWRGGSDSKTEFALILFAGMVVFNLFAECANRSPGLILSNVNYVKKIIFPLEILPVVALGAAAFHLLVSVLVWLLFHVLFFGMPHLTLLLLPFILLPLMLFTLGIAWLLASLGVYLRDVGQIVGVATTALLFLSPIFYPVSALPENYQTLLHFNPLTLVIEQTRQVLISGTMPNIKLWGLYLIGSSTVAWFGFAWFQRTRRGFADVL
ncbi:ABC transporter permease [Thiothrix sp. UBA2332]|uniref:ABC transporter permease n=1 Tax=Thiothrix sp. UBA2332 TaxID=1947696 RepID=UPI0025CEE6A5|nr:ABC transporter permease [Thiothrix sp. UBA2332]